MPNIFLKFKFTLPLVDEANPSIFYVILSYNEDPLQSFERHVFLCLVETVAPRIPLISFDTFESRKESFSR